MTTCWSRFSAAAYAGLKRKARTMCGQRVQEADIEDLVQDTLFEALRSAHKLRKKKAAPAWIAGILAHKCIDLIRRRSAAHALPVPPADNLEEIPARTESGIDRFLLLKIANETLRELIREEKEGTPKRLTYEFIQRTLSTEPPASPTAERCAPSPQAPQSGASRWHRYKAMEALRIRCRRKLRSRNGEDTEDGRNDANIES